MPSRFLNNININDEYTLPSADGSADQIITTDGAGQLSFVDQTTITAGNAEHVVIYAKNTSGASISKGTPVYITGTVGATDTVEIAPADAGNSAKMPAVGLLDDTLANNAFGYVITGGFMDNITTDPIDGATPSSNDTVYVKSGGGLTLTKPTGTNFIQNVAKVGKVSGGNSGSLIVSSILRTNDVPTPLYVDHANQRLGIVTTSPGSALEVQGEIDANGGDGYRIETKPFANWASDVLTLGDWDGEGYSTRIMGSNSSEVMRVTGSNVGIGTTSPSSKLQVNGDLTVGDDSTVGSFINVIAAGSSQDAGIRFGSESNTDSKAAIYTNTSNSDLHFDVTETTRMLIDSGTGNVGIGTNSPGAKLEVEQSNSSTNTVFLSNSFNNKGFRTGHSGYATFAGYQDSNNTASGSAYGSLIGLNTFYNGTNFYSDNQYIDPSSILFKDGNILFHTNNISATGNFTPYERVRITKTGTVGIGTNSPTATLDVDGSGIGAKIHSQQSIGLQVSGGGNSSDIARFQNVSGSTKVTINHQGDVGIGTTSPVDKLDVRGTARITSPQANDWIVLAQNYATGAPSGFWDSNGNVHLYLRNSSSGTNVLIRPDSSSYFNGGNVGIGTTSPTSKLHVAQDQNNTFSTALAWTASANDVLNITNNNSTDTNNYASLYMRADGSSGSFSSRIVARNTTAGTGELHFQLRDSAHTSNTETKLMIDSGGNVGIGETNPAQKLHVIGNSEITGDIFLGRYIFHNDDNNTWLGFPLADTISFRTNGSDRMYITSAGNVGIGTTNPSEKLHVYNGKAYVTPISYAANQSAYALRIGAYNSTNFDMGLQAKSTSGGSPYMSFRTSSADDTLTIWGGSVGVGGIGIPSYTLDVDGQIRGEQYLRLKDTGGTNRFSIRAESTYGTIDNGSNTLNYNASNHLFLSGLSEKMRINSFGNVGIGTTTPLYLLDAAGTIRCTSLIQTSQSDKKENIGDIDKSKPKAIPFKEYRYKSDIDSTGRKRYGVLAEDIENDYPELVYVDSNGNKAVNYIDLLVKRVAELEKELEDISLTPGPKGDKGDTGAQGPAGANGTNGKDGANGNDHLKNVQSITFNEKTGQLEITIEGYKSPFRFNPAK